MRIITDELYARIIKLLVQDEKVAIFQQLLLTQKAEPTENKADEITVKSEGDK